MLATSGQRSVPIDILWPRFVSIADEVAITLVQTSFSTDVRENFDMAAALFDAQGRMVAQGNISATGHTGCMPYIVKSILEKVPVEQIRPGDVLITNDPWLGSGHTPDTFVVTPVFLSDRIVAFVMTSAHQLDIGGRQSSTQSREIYEEGLRIPVMWLFRGGEPNHDLFQIIRENVRFAETIIGDVHAQVSANHVGAQRIMAVMQEAGLKDLQQVTDQIIALTETTMRRAIAEIPDGVYENEMLVEEPDEGYEPLLLRVKLTIRGETAAVDFAGSSAQVDRPVNVVLNFTKAYTMVALKLACDPNLPNNEGAHLPITVTAPEGSVVNAKPPAPVYWRVVVGHSVFEVVFGALLKALPNRIPAQSGCVPVWLYTFSGYRTSGNPFLLHSHSYGGMGAGPKKDGLNSIGFPYSVRDLPTEILENETPLLTVSRELACDSGGAGRFRGGCGEELVLRAAPGRADARQPIVLSIAAGRFRFAPKGVLGGEPGRLGSIRLNGTSVGYPVWQDVYFGVDDAIRLELPGGGGYGDPRERDRASLARDLDEGYVSRQAARDQYGFQS